MAGNRGTAALSPGQASLVPEVRDEWIDIARTAGPADRAAAEEAVSELYRAAGHEPPRHVVWCPSPLGFLLTVAVLTQAVELRRRYPDRVGLPRWIDAYTQHGYARELTRHTWQEMTTRFGGGPVDPGPRIHPALFPWPASPLVDPGVFGRLRDDVERPVAESDPVNWEAAGEQAWDQLWKLGADPDEERDADWDVTADGLVWDLDSVWEAVWDEVMIQNADGCCDAPRLAVVDLLSRTVPGFWDSRIRSAAVRLARAGAVHWTFARVVVLTERPAALVDAPGDRSRSVPHWSDGFVG